MLNLLQYRAWALSEAYFNRMYPVVTDAIRLGHDLVKKKSVEDFIPAIQSLLSVSEEFGHPPVESDLQITFSRDQSSGLPVANVNNQSIALIPVIGPLSKYGDLCSMGMQDYQGMINRANVSPTIDGIVLIMDTPGGTVDGTPEFGLSVKNSQKPVGIFGDNMVASAGLWIASQASVIVGNKNNPTEFGSIGVLMALPNYKNVMDAGNAPTVEIFRAAQSTEKAMVNVIEPISEDSRAMVQKDLNSMADQFISTVKAGRGDKLNAKADGLFNGRMFDVYDSKKNGLIDSIGTLQTAVNKVAELAKTQKKNNSNPNNSDMKILELLGISKEQKAKLSAEEQAKLDSVEQKLTDQETKISAFETEKKALEQRAKDAEAKATAAEAKAADLQKKLDEKPAGPATSVVADKDAGKENEGKSKFDTSVDADAKNMRAMVASFNNETPEKK